MVGHTLTDAGYLESPGEGAFGVLDTCRELFTLSQIPYSHLSDPGSVLLFIY